MNPLWFGCFRKSLNKKNKNPKNREIPPPTSVNSTTTSASSSASEFHPKNGVFLSFRGTDIRQGFIDLLHTHLEGAGIRTYKDDNDLRIGEEIGPDLLKAIKDSKFFIPIFSKNYASSELCLLELAKMVECHRTEGQIIFPIFYGVHPSDVRNQERSYKNAFLQHKKNFDEKTIQGWKDAMRMVGEMKGFELEVEEEVISSKLVMRRIHQVVLGLGKNYMHISDYLMDLDVNSIGVRIVNSTTALASTSATSSAADLEGEYDVFLNFRGTDTRLGFTDFLYTDLVSAGIYTFRDDNELRIGEEIGPDLRKAIEDSKISIPIFSKNYAYSKWCLCELVHMVKCKANNVQKIFPIFYDVDVSDVKNQSGSYEEAFTQHGKNFKEETVKEWRNALKTVGQLKGYELKRETNGHEGELVKKVVRDVLLQLKKNYAHVPDDLVGMDHHVQQMTRLLQVNSDGVRIVGIHGMGGIGKTTIAKVIYNKLCDSFDCCCFLEDVRERAKQHPDGLVDLQKQLVSKIRERDLPIIGNVHDGIKKIKDAVHRKKVLIVLDDVDKKCQFDKLAGECNWFHKASRIIVTTRNKEVLNALEVTCSAQGLFEAYRSYEPKLMNRVYSLQLFSKKAFMRDSPLEEYFTLSEEVVSIASGLPLVLVTLGSLFLGNRNKALWRAKLKKLEKIPPENVMGKLRISFDALDGHDKKIFLDIACLFSGKDKTKPYYMWAGCGFVPEDRINTLVLRSLVKVGDDNKLRMHDQLRDLGRQIVQEESLYKLSRVWRPKEALDALDVLEGGLGTKNVEALNLDLRAITEDEELYIRRFVRRGFSQLPNLRLLRLGFAELDGNFENTFSNLRWLKWRCSGKSVPINLNMKNLVILDLSNSEITDEWEGWTLLKATKTLKVLNLKECTGLRRGPNFSTLTNLEILNLRDTRLTEINPSLGNLVTLRALDLSGCNLPKLDCSTFKDLESLNLHSSESLLEVSGLEWSESLTNLKASKCARLRTLGDLSNLKSLSKLNIYHCVSLTEIKGLEKLESLELLNMGSCSSIVRLPDLSNSRMLKKLFLSYCCKLVEVGGLGGLASLEHLDMNWCDSMERLPDLSSLGNLKTLSLHACHKLREIEGLRGLVSLERLDLSSCKSLGETMDFSGLKNLKELIAIDLKHLTEIRGLEELTSLEVLSILGCSLLEKLPDLSNLKSLKRLYAKGCEKLSEIRGLEELKKRHCWVGLDR